MSDTETADISELRNSRDSPPINSNLEREQQITANSDLEQVSKILKNSFKTDPTLEDKSSFYPLQPKAQYMSPNVTLSAESKRIVRQAQAPILQASSRVVHFLYEVRLIYPIYMSPAKTIAFS